MRISHERRFIFFAVPRTGSNSVRNVLDEYSDVRSIHISETTDEHPFYHHISPREVVEIFDRRGWDYGAYRTFCFVRNPYDRVASLFHHRLWMLHGDGILGRLRRRAEVMLRRQKRFTQFVEKRVDDWAGRLEEPISSFITDERGNTLVDAVLRFESLNTQLPEYLEETFGIPVTPADVPRKNISNRRDYREYYDEHTKSIVRSTYEDDLRTFDYQF